MEVLGELGSYSSPAAWSLAGRNLVDGPSEEPQQEPLTLAWSPQGRECPTGLWLLVGLGDADDSRGRRHTTDKRKGYAS